MYNHSLYPQEKDEYGLVGRERIVQHGVFCTRFALGNHIETFDELHWLIFFFYESHRDSWLNNPTTYISLAIKISISSQQIVFILFFWFSCNWNSKIKNKTQKTKSKVSKIDV